MKHSEQTRSNILHLIKSHYLTDKQFYETISMSKAAFYKFKKGISNLSLDSLISISEAFHIPIDTLIFTDMTKKSDMVNDTEKDIKEVLIKLSRDIEDIRDELDMK